MYKLLRKDFIKTFKKEKLSEKDLIEYFLKDNDKTEKWAKVQIDKIIKLNYIAKIKEEKIEKYVSSK